MKIQALIENTKWTETKTPVKKQHGISLYIEMADKKILFDTGRNSRFLRNAQSMGADVASIDYLVISHAHADHGGGLATFLRHNSKAKVFLHKESTKPYYTKAFGFLRFYIGLNTKIIKERYERFLFVEGDTTICPGLTILAKKQGTFPDSPVNQPLIVRNEAGFSPDDFQHEIILTIQGESGLNVFTGCSHSGITNMLDTVRGKFPTIKIDNVFGGFHLINPINREQVPKDYLTKLGNKLKDYDAVFYTGHCTGGEATLFLQELLGKEKIRTFQTGQSFSI